KASENFLILNDSKSTNWASTLAALHSIKSDVRWGSSKIFLCVGGKCRGHHDMPSQEIIEQLQHYQIHLCLFGEFGQKYAESIREHFSDLKVAIEFESILGLWDQSGVFLFSPAFPSFDQFKSYSERGERFKQLVNLSLK